MRRITSGLLIVLALLAGPAGPRAEDAPAGGGWLSVADVATRLAENGFRVLEVERESDRFEVEVADRQGNLLEIYVHPVTGVILRTESRGRAPDPSGQSGWLTLAQVARRFEAEGYTVRKIEIERTGFELELTDRAGARTEVDVDPASGTVLRSRPD